MDLSTLMRSLSPDEQLRLVTAVMRGVQYAPYPQRFAEHRLLCLVQDAISDGRGLETYLARVLGYLFTAPEGMDLAGVNTRVLELLEEQGRITRSAAYSGRWLITRSGASLLYRSGRADELIAQCAAEVTA